MAKYGRISAKNWAKRQEGWKNGYQRALLLQEQFMAKIFRQKRDKRRARVAVLFVTTTDCHVCHRLLTLQPGRVNQALLSPVEDGKLICPTCKGNVINGVTK